MSIEADLPRPTVLVVDDNPTNLAVVADFLETGNLKVVTALDGPDGLATARDFYPDLILLDVVMPGLDGFEVCRQLKACESTQDIPVIFMTSLAGTEDKVRGFEAGAVDYVTKPVNQEEVLARVRTHLKLRQLTHNLQVQNVRLQKMATELEGLYRQVTRFNQELDQLVQQRTQELEEAYQTLKMMDKAKSDFIAVAAHELRSPLTLVQGYTEMLELEAELSPDIKTLTQGILTGQRRLHEIVNSILDVSKIDSQVLQVCRKPIHLLDILEGLCEQFGPDLKERHLTLTLTGLDDLPVIQADLDLMSKLFYHLIVNAIKYTPNGGSIMVSGKLIAEVEEKAWIEIIVQDTGIGIDPAYHKLIFEKFFQTGEARFHSSGKTKFKGGGPGLGLAIARGVVQAHGGRIWVESLGYSETTHSGSVFYVLLPVTNEPAAVIEAEDTC